MLNHVVTFKLTPDAPEGQAQRICDALEALAETLPEMKSLRCGPDVGLRDGNASLALVATFDSWDDFLVYVADAEHGRINKELIFPYMAEGQRVQFSS